MSDIKKCGTTDCKLYSKWTGDNCGKLVENRRVELCQGYTEAPRPDDSSGSNELAGSVTKTLNDTQMIDIIIRSYQRMGRTVTETAWEKDARGFSQLVLVFGDE